MGCPLLFIIVMGALYRGFLTGIPWDLLYANGLIIITDLLGMGCKVEGVEGRERGGKRKDRDGKETEGEIEGETEGKIEGKTEGEKEAE